MISFVFNDGLFKRKKKKRRGGGVSKFKKSSKIPRDSKEKLAQEFLSPSFES